MGRASTPTKLGMIALIGVEQGLSTRAAQPHVLYLRDSHGKSG
jgi:hypothetical protein